MGLGIVLFCSMFGAAPAAGTIPDEPTRPQIHARPTNPKPVAPHEMSDEEKERRREVCNREFEYCYDWCSKTNKTAKQQRFCYEEKCVPKLADCMKQIPD